MSITMRAKIKEVHDQISKIVPPEYLKANIAIGFAASTIENVANKRLKQYHLNHSSYIMLNLLVENGGSLNITDITKKLYLSRQAIALMTRDLEKRKLVTRDGHKGDRRKLRVILTEEGLELVRELGIAESRIQMHNVLVSLLNKAEAMQLAAMLNSIASKMRRIKIK